MALQHLRSNTASKRPTAGAMSDGQIAINTNATSPGLFFKDAGGSIIKVGPVHVGTTAPNSSPAGSTGNSLGEQWLDTSSGGYVLKIWDGSAWRSEVGEFVNAAGDTMTGDLIMNNANIVFEGSTDDGFETTLTVVDPTADRTITLPNVTGTVVTTGDTGTVTSTMIADGTIANADVNASAAIAGTKISPDFGAQNVTTTGTSTAASFIPTSSTVPTNGVYLPSANNVAISTNGTGRLFVGSSGDVTAKDVGFYIEKTGLGNLQFTFDGSTSSIISNSSSAPLVLGTNSAERLRITSAGQLSFIGAGSSGSPAVGFNGSAPSNSLVIDSTGKVGLGTSSPSGLLHVSGTSGTPAIFERTGSNGVFLGLKDGSGSFSYVGNTNGVFSIQTPGSSYSDKLVVTSAGNVGIGSTTVSHQLDVVSASTAVAEFSGPANAAVEFKGSGFVEGKIQCGGEFIVGSTNNYPVAFVANNSEKARIDSSGRLGIGNSSLSSYNASADDLVVGNHTGAHGVTICSQNNSSGYIMFADGTTGAQTYAGQITYDHTNNRLTLGTTDGTTGLTVDSSQRVGVGTTAPTAPLEVSATNAGVRITSSNTGTSYVNLGDTDSANIGGIEYYHTTNNLAFVVNAGEAFRVDSSRRLLVGTSSTSSNNRLVVQSNTDLSTGPATLFLAKGDNAPISNATLGLLRFGGSAHVNSAEIYAFRDGGTWTAGSSLPTALAFSTTADGASSPTERMRITNGGDLIMADGRQIFVFGNGDSPRGKIVAQNTANNTTATLVEFRGWDNSVTGTITTRVNVTAYNTSSDYRLKENIVDLEDASSRIKLLKPKRFNFTANPDETLDGFLAHEAQLAVPEAVSGYKDQIDVEGNPVHQGVDLGKFVPLLTAALQEAIGRIETLEAEVAALKAS